MVTWGKIITVCVGITMFSQMGLSGSPYEREEKWCGDPTYDFRPETHRILHETYQGYYRVTQHTTIGGPVRNYFGKSTVMKHFLLEEGDRVFLTGNEAIEEETGMVYEQVRVDCTALPLTVWVLKEDCPYSPVD
ncbi:MAG: hypothetical protein HRU19_28625 [Pseudobacteriovorax sp.]|nr:hypothetical protein [Pseudobacteriovorax sp.]